MTSKYIYSVFILILLLIISSSCSLNNSRVITSNKKNNIAELEELQTYQSSLAEKINSKEKILAQYASLDDFDNVITTMIQLAQLYQQQGSQQSALKYINRAHKLSRYTKNKNILYSLNMTQGIIKQNSKYFQSALVYTTSPLDRALTYAHLNEQSKALKIVETKLQNRKYQASDYAFVYYKYAKKYNAVNKAKQALVGYKQEENSMGIAKSLLLIAKLYYQQSSLQAYKFHERARLVIASITETNSKKILIAEEKNLWKK